MITSSWKIYSPKKIWDDGLQIHVYTNDDESKVIGWYYIKDGDASLYRQMIGSLMYLTNTRPDICFAVNTLCQYMVEPRHVHLTATKQVLRYLKGIVDYGLWYVPDCEFGLVGYTDLDWCSRKQMSVALSMDEAEYIDTCSACSEALWLWKFLSGLFDIELHVNCIYCDNQSCIKCFMTSPSKLTSSTSIFVIWWRRELWSFSMLP